MTVSLNNQHESSVYNNKTIQSKTVKAMIFNRHEDPCLSNNKYKHKYKQINKKLNMPPWASSPGNEWSCHGYHRALSLSPQHPLLDTSSLLANHLSESLKNTATPLEEDALDAIVPGRSVLKG